jgi:predicted ribosomally synthesized peptide with SipW-like signal peptide
MSDNPIELSRRKILAGLGTIGAASAGVGLGTSAYFSDEETFTNNTLVAGSLDLKVDWEEHYSDWSEDEAEGVGEVVMTKNDPAEVPEDYVGLPDPTEPLIAVPSADLGTFMDNTAVEAYPDTDDDGVQDAFAAEPGGETEDGVGYICADGADTPEDLDPNGGTGLRTEKGPEAPRGEATVDENGDPLPLINISDVKPGDFGELTLSFHLCDNPGYVWMFADNVMASENGHTEPERKDEDEEDGVVELLDAVQTTWWYDEDGDNVLDLEGAGEEAQETDVMIVFDSSGSMDSEGGKLQSAKDGAKALVDALGPGAEVGLVTFEDVGDEEVEATLADSDSDVKTAVDNITVGGSTAIGAGINLGQDQLQNGAGARNGANKAMVVLTNGGENEGTDPVTAANDAKSAGTTIYAIAYGSGADEDLVEDISSGPKVDDGTIDDQDDKAFEGGQADIETIFGDIGGAIQVGGEEVIFRGTLRDSLDLLTSDPGLPLDGNLDTAFDEGTGDPSAEAREAFEASSTHYIGFAWYLPVDHANEIQTDSAMFDLGFYTEQARHNDGDGMSREETTTQPST